MEGIDKKVKPIGVDADGFETLTKAVSEMLNQCPGLNGREVLFEELGESSGIAFFADNGALILSEKRSITDHVRQQCAYPFYAAYRMEGVRESRKLQAQAFLARMGKWLCKEPVCVDGQTVRLSRYPKLSGGRRITRVTRSNAYGLEPGPDGVQDWLLPVTVQYANEFDLW